MEYRSGGTIREGSLKSHGLNLPQEFGESAAPLPNNGSLELGEDSAHVKHGLASGRSVWKRAGFSLHLDRHAEAGVGDEDLLRKAGLPE